MHEVVGLVLLVPVVGLATWQICEIWNHGSIFEEWKQKCELLTELWWARLLSCMFCLSNWVALLCGVLALLTLKVSIWFSLPLFMFAGARLANLGNDLFKDACLTPTADDGFSETTPADEEVSRRAPFAGIFPDPDGSFTINSPERIQISKPGFESNDFHA